MKKLGALVSATCCCPPGVDNRQPALQTAGKMDRGRVASVGGNGWEQRQCSSPSASGASAQSDENVWLDPPR